MHQRAADQKTFLPVTKSDVSIQLIQHRLASNKTNGSSKLVGLRLKLRYPIANNCDFSSPICFYALRYAPCPMRPAQSPALFSISPGKIASSSSMQAEKEKILQNKIA
jgi:hypothetical protein